MACNREALKEELPIESDVIELPLTVSFREGKEVVRDAGGRLKGVIDCQFADVSWDHSALEVG